ncbi:MAG TPA: hypothetical protein VK447_01455 [Myxococcaceae bacterium]|nr:hypothetical protein [Myxococcaceae bacterium]
MVKSSCQVVLFSVFMSSVAVARTPPAAESPETDVTASETAPSMGPPAKARGGKSPSAQDFANRVVFVIVGSALGESLGAFGGGRLGASLGASPGGFGDITGTLAGTALGGAVGAGLGTILVGSLLPGDGNKTAGAVGALLGMGASALLTVPLIFVVGPFALIVPVIATVVGYQIGYGMRPAEPAKPAEPVANVLPYVNVFSDGSGGRVGLVGTF